MTTLTWIYVVTGFVMGAIALASFWGMRKLRSKLTRQSLWPVCDLDALWRLLFQWGFISVIYYATVAVIFIPTIVWILRLPKDDHAA